MDNPACLVIAGGPEPDYKDPDFFRKHPYIDVIVVQDGEITFSNILVKLVHGDRDFRDIGGLYLPGENEDHIYTGTAQVPAVFDYSPYVSQNDYYERLFEDYAASSFDVILETNRGCPYSCSFCDWGSNTASKVRCFDIKRIQEEVDWLGRMGIHSIMLADANFGILPRDVEIAELLNRTCTKYIGHPRHIFYSAAKNNPERVIAIAEKFARSGICTSHALSIQHTRPEVLDATNRSNISTPKQLQVVKALLAAQIPIEAQLVLGIPGDTYSSWKRCLNDLMEWGVHEDYLIQAYRLLPNAPAAEREFIADWNIKTIERVMFDQTLRELHQDANITIRRPETIVVASRSYTRDDWVVMSTYAAFIKALHNASLTQCIAVYLRLTHDISYLDFYELLIEDFFQRTTLMHELYHAVLNHYHNFLNDQLMSDHMQVKALPRLSYALHPSRWLYVQMCLQLEEFFGTLECYLLEKFGSMANLSSVIDYQKHLIILPSFDRDMGKTFRINHDWMSYFDEAKLRDGSQKMGEPSPTNGVRAQVIDHNCGERIHMMNAGNNRPFYEEPLDWGDGDTEDRWCKWIERVALGRSSSRINNFQQICMESCS
jgi:putative methyltransferase